MGAPSSTDLAQLHPLLGNPFSSAGKCIWWLPLRAQQAQDPSPAARGGVGWVLSIPGVSLPICKAEGALLTPLEQRGAVQMEFGITG